MQKAKKLFMLMAMLFCGMAAAWAAQTVTVIQPQNGQVTFSPATPAAGEMVTITVTPDQGYCIHKADIVVSKIINPGSAQSPARIGIAENIEISGIEPTDPTLEANYTFVMPADPINVQISATFSEAPSYTVSLDPAADTENGDATFRPTEAKKGETVNIELAPVLGYQVSNVTASYMAMSTQTQVDVTKVNDLLYTFVMPAANVNVLPTFELKQFEIKISDNIENGTVTANRPTAGMDEEVILTVTPAEGYQVKEVIYTWYPGGESDATGTIFEKIPYNIIVAETQNGSIQVAEDKTTAGIGEEVTFFAYPDAGYQVSNVSVSYMAMSTQTEVPVTDNNGERHRRLQQADRRNGRGGYPHRHSRRGLSSARGALHMVSGWRQRRNQHHHPRRERCVQIQHAFHLRPCYSLCHLRGAAGEEVQHHRA